MAQVSRLTNYTNGSIIDAVIHNQEHDVFVNGINDVDTRLTAVESGNLTITGNKTFNGTMTLGVTTASSLSVSGTATVTGFLTLGQTTPSQNAHAASKLYVDTKFGAGLLGFNTTTAPVYGNTTQFTVAQISCRNSTNTDTITKSSTTTVDITTTGLNGLAQSAASQFLGTVTVSSGSASVTGSSTAFLTDFQVGDVISVTGSESRRITAVSSNTSLTVESTFVTSASAVAYYRGGRAPNTFFNLYAVSDTVSNTGLVLSTRNIAGGDSIVDLPSSLNTVSSFDATADTCTTTANHNLRNGLAIVFNDATGTSTLPSGLAFATTYYAHVNSSTTFTMHTNSTDALTGASPINITGSKTGTVTVSYVSYSNVRQLPFALRTDASTTTPLITPFYCVGGPYRPLIIYNTAYDDSTFSNTTTSVLSGGVATSFTDVSTSTWIPAISRQGLFWYWSAGAIRTYLQAKGTPSTTGVPRLTVANNSYELIVDTDSSRNIQYKNSGATAVNVAVRGYYITEVY